MSKEQSLSVVKKNKFSRIISFLKEKFLGNKIYKQNIYEKISQLEQELININKEDITKPIVKTAKRTTENRIAVLKYRATLKKRNKNYKKIVIE